MLGVAEWIASHLDQALTTLTESVVLWRQLADADPDAHQPRLAEALRDLGDAEREAGHPDQALTTLTESVDLYRQLADADPDAHQRWLAEALLYRSYLAADVEGGTAARQWALQAPQNFTAAAHRDTSDIYKSRTAAARRWLATLPLPDHPDVN